MAAAGCAEQKPSIGFVTINLQAQFFTQMADGAQKAASEAGVELKLVDGNNEPARQVQAIENFITQGVKAIVVVAIDVEGIKPAISAAREAGIPVISIDNRVAVPPAHAFIGVDNVAAGGEAAAYLVRLVNETMNGRANVGIVGSLNSLIQNQRRDGFMKVAEAAAGLKIVGTVNGQNVQEQALAAAENLVTAHPEMQFIYATGEPALIGAIAAVESQGAADRIKIVGWDLSRQALGGLDRGIVQAIVQQDPYQEGYRGVLAGSRLASKQSVPPENFIPITLVTRANVEKFRR